MSNTMSQEKKSAIALIASGAGALTLGILTCASEASIGVKNFLNFYDPVGPLSGKTTYTVIVYLFIWLVLSMIWSEKKTELGRMLTLAITLTCLGLVLTFPPIFELFGVH